MVKCLCVGLFQRWLVVPGSMILVSSINAIQAVKIQALEYCGRMDIIGMFLGYRNRNINFAGYSVADFFDLAFRTSPVHHRQKRRDLLREMGHELRICIQRDTSW